MTMAIAKASVARKEPHEGRLEDRQHASTCSRMCRALGMGRLRLLKAQQAPAEHEEVRQCARDHKPMPVLGQAAVAHLGEAEDAFDHADRMLDPGARTRDFHRFVARAARVLARRWVKSRAWGAHTLSTAAWPA